MAHHQHSKTKTILVAGIFLSSLVWIPVAGAKPPTEEAATPPVTREEAVKTFTVAPAQRNVAILMPNAQTPQPPAPMNSATKSGILKSLGGSGGIPAPVDGKEQTKPTLEHLLLSATQPFFSERGFLTLTRANTVHPETAINFTGELHGSAGVKLKVEKGRTYLLDFAVRGAGSGTYLLVTESGKQEFEDNSATRQHILLALNATSSGWTTVRLNREGAGYYLYSVEVTRVN